MKNPSQDAGFLWETLLGREKHSEYTIPEWERFPLPKRFLIGTAMLEMFSIIPS